MMHWNLRTLVLLTLTFAPACDRSAGPSSTRSAAHVEAQIPAMTVAELAAALERPGAVAVYDANSRERYEQGHIPTARHVGHDAVTAAVLPPDRTMRLVFYCYNEH